MKTYHITIIETRTTNYQYKAETKQEAENYIFEALADSKIDFTNSEIGLEVQVEDEKIYKAKEKQNRAKVNWIKEILSNNEVSSDEELVSLFMKEGEIPEREARVWISKRMFYLNNIVMDDGTIYDPRKSKH